MSAAPIIPRDPGAAPLPASMPPADAALLTLDGACVDTPDRAPARASTLRVRHEALRRGGRVVLQPGELSLPAGVTAGLVGANGAGKSTLLLALAGLLRTPRGAVELTSGGEPPASVGLVPQQPSWPSWLRVRQVTRLLGVDADHLADTAPALALASLLDRPARILSAGQAQMLAMACALLRDDPLLLLDEPFAAVDLVRRHALRDLLARARARRLGLVTILSSHAAAELLTTCDWLVALRDGRYVHNGPRDAFLASASIEPTAPDAAARFERALVDLVG